MLASSLRTTARHWRRYRETTRWRHGEPPLVLAPVPWVGHAPHMSGDFTACLRDLAQTHGDVVTLIVAGKRMHFLLDPRDYPRLFAERERLQFHDVAHDLSRRMFGHPELDDPAIDHDVLWGADRHLKGEGLDRVYAAYCKHLVTALARRVQRSPEIAELEHEVQGLMFDAAGDAMFGAGFADDATETAFREFDAAIPLLSLGVPSGVLKTSRRARTHLMARLRDEFGDPDSEYLKARARALRGAWGPDDVALYQIGGLWASQANTVNAAYWALALAREHAPTWQAIVEEVRGSDPEVFDTVGGLRKLKLSHAVVFEALRLSASNMAVRLATRDFEFELLSGTYRIRAGDWVTLWGQLTHEDSRIFPEATRFDPTRFLPVDGKPPRFELEGTALPFAFIPFGGGSSMCPGRFMAVVEIQRLIVELVRNYDFELLDPVPLAFETRRAGLGIRPASHKAPRVRARWQSR